MPERLSPNDAERLRLLKRLASPEVLKKVKRDRKMATSRKHGALHLYLTKDGLNVRGSHSERVYDIDLGDMGKYIDCTEELNFMMSPSLGIIHEFNLSKGELECCLSMLGFK